MSDRTERSADLAKLSEVSTKRHTFKNPHRIPPVRRFKATRQLITDEQKYLQTKENIKFDTPTWQSTAAPPTLKPVKHYCDITGLEGKYKNPANGLRFHNVEVYQQVIRSMQPGVDQEYLELRGAHVILK